MTSLSVPHRKPIPGMETYREKATRKFKENPWVPLGSLATAGALIIAMVKMRRGESRSFNHWLRVRVAAQGLTIGALVLGTYSLRDQGQEREFIGSQNDADVERRREEKIAKDRMEFEGRLKEAEAAHEFERTGGMMGTGGPGTGTGMNADGSGTMNTSPSPSPLPAQVNEKSDSRGHGWLGWWRS